MDPTPAEMSSPLTPVHAKWQMWPSKKLLFGSIALVSLLLGAGIVYAHGWTAVLSLRRGVLTQQGHGQTQCHRDFPTRRHLSAAEALQYDSACKTEQKHCPTAVQVQGEAGRGLASNWVFSWGHNNSEFSNWYPVKFNDPATGTTYANTEQYMMTHKALMFGDKETYAKMMKTSDPAKVQALGHLVVGFHLTVWYKQCFQIVLDGNRLKFSQHPKLKALLMGTGSKGIAEASPHDAVWGIGLDAATAQSIPPDQWPGCNLQGKVLMALRDEFNGNSRALSATGPSKVNKTPKEAGLQQPRGLNEANATETADKAKKEQRTQR